MIIREQVLTVTDSLLPPSDRAASRDEAAFNLVKMSDRFFPDSLMQFMETEAPKTFSLYVR